MGCETNWLKLIIQTGFVQGADPMAHHWCILNTQETWSTTHQACHKKQTALFKHCFKQWHETPVGLYKQKFGKTEELHRKNQNSTGKEDKRRETKTRVRQNKRLKARARLQHRKEISSMLRYKITPPQKKQKTFMILYSKLYVVNRTVLQECSV